MVLAHHNGCVGYVPTAGAYAEGGYEVVDAVRYYGTMMMEPESERLIVNAAVDLLSGLARHVSCANAAGDCDQGSDG